MNERLAGLRAHLDALNAQQSDARRASIEEMARVHSEIEATQVGIQAVHREAAALSAAAEQRARTALRETEVRLGVSLQNEAARVDAALEAESRERRLATAGLEQAIARNAARAEGEVRRLNGALQALRDDIVRKEQAALRNASELVGAASSRVARLRAAAPVLDVEAFVTQAVEAIRHAEQQTATGRGEAAVAAAAAAASAAMTLEVEVERRRGRMRGAAAALRRELGEVRAFAERLRPLFGKDAAEVAHCAGILEEYAARWERCDDYPRFQAEQGRILECARKLAVTLRLLDAHTPALRAQIASRNRMLKEYVRPRLSHALAGMVDKDGWKVCPTLPDDATAPVLISARSGETTVTAFVELDGGARVETSGQPSFAECERISRIVDEVFARPMSETTLTSGNPIAAARPRPPPVSAWRSVRDEIRALVAAPKAG